MHKLLLQWVLVALGVQAVRVRKLSASLQSESDRKESGPKVHALMPMLLAFSPSASNAFAVQPGSPPGGVSGVSTVGTGPMISRLATPEMLDHGSKVRVLWPASFWYQEVGTVATIASGAEQQSAVVRFDTPSGAFTDIFALDELAEIEAPKQKATTFHYVPKAATIASRRLGPTMMVPEDEVQPAGTGGEVNPLSYRLIVPGDDRYPWPAQPINNDDNLWQGAGTGDDVEEVMETLSAANLVSPTGEEPGIQRAAEESFAGTSGMLAVLQGWFMENPQGVVALPLGPDGSSADQGMLSYWNAADADMASFLGEVSSGEDWWLTIGGGKPASSRTAVMSATDDSVKDVVKDMEQQTTMNLILLGGAAVPVGWQGGGFVHFFVPQGGSGAFAGLVAKDDLGKDVLFDNWLSAHQGNRKLELEYGLKSDAQYLIVTANNKIEDYTLNTVCTHLHCVVPSWDEGPGNLVCPCQTSQYDNTGKVVRGPAPLSLAVAQVDTWIETDLMTGDVSLGNKVTLTPSKTDFRKGTAPWWK